MPHRPTTVVVWAKVLCLLLLVGRWTNALAGDTLVSDTLALPIEYGQPVQLAHIPYYSDPTLSLDAEAVSQLFSSPGLAAQLLRIQQNQSLFSKAAYWAKITLVNSGDYPQNISIFLQNAFLDSVQFFRNDGLGMYDAGIAGTLVDIPLWTHPDRLPSIPVQVKAGARIELLIRVRNTLRNRSMAPIFVATTASYSEYKKKELALWALKMGLLLTLGLLALIFSYTEGNKVYGWVATMTFCLISLALVKSGYAREFELIVRGGMSIHLVWVTTAVLYIVYLRFAMAFIRIKQSAPFIYLCLNTISIAAAGVIPIYSVFWPYLKEWRHTLIPAMTILQMPGLILLLWSCAYSYSLAKHRSVAIFIATVSLVVGGILDAYATGEVLTFVGNFGFSDFPGALMALGVICGVIFYELYAQRKRREQLSGLLRRKQLEVARSFVMGQETERRRLGRELHDHLAALLLNARMMMPIDRQPPESWNATEREGYLRGLQSLDKGLNEVRTLAYQLDPHPLNASLLRNELERLLQNLKLSRPMCAFHLDFDANSLQLNPDTALDLYRICQECLSNIMKHAAATSVFVRLTQVNGLIRLSFDDNGIGFEPTRVPPGIGLKSVRTRLERMESHRVEIESTPGVGTKVLVSFRNDYRAPTADMKGAAALSQPAFTGKDREAGV